MDYSIRVKAQKVSKEALIINESLAKRLNVDKKRHGFVSFGTEKAFVNITFSQEVEENEIFLSSDVIEILHIPDYPIYEIRSEGNEVIIGPCIGIIASSKDENITKRRLKNFELNNLSYQRVNGAVIVFSLDKVKRSKRLVEGYCYNPQRDSWERGVFPYPLALFRRTHLSAKWKNHFLSAIGDRVFSNYSFNKWDMYQWFDDEQEIKPYLPATRIYNSKEDIISMLKTYRSLYIKPVWGMKGFGVIKATLENEEFTFRYRKDGENITVSTEDNDELEEIIERLFVPGNHLIQQGLNLIKYENRIVDFRCVMQKNEACKWQCNGIFARIGADESVVSNISSGGAAMPAMDLIKDTLTVNEDEIFTLREKMISLSTKICRKLDEYGFNFATLGMDIGMDEEKKLWLIEVNNRNPHPGIALRANDIPNYYTILTEPLHYAKALSGFGHKGDNN